MKHGKREGRRKSKMRKSFWRTGLAGVFLVSSVWGSSIAPLAAKEDISASAGQIGQGVVIPKLKGYAVAEKYRAQTVSFSGYSPGTIVIDPKNYFLYYVEAGGQARRYGIAVGKEDLDFNGTAVVRIKRTWPRWIPTPQMVERNPKHYGRYANGMDGGPGNPLGARALYLYQGDKDTYIRIHGTIQPWTIGSSASNGCFRMTNDDVLDLYDRVKVGAEVVVL